MASYPAGPRPWDSAGAGGGIRTPDRLITNQLLYRTELRQPDKDASLARLVPRRQPTPGTPAPHPFHRPGQPGPAAGTAYYPVLWPSDAMPPPLRVLHALHDYLPRHQAGSEIYVAHLCAAQRRAGLQPTVLAAEFDPDARPRPAHVAVARRRAGGRSRQHAGSSTASTAAIAIRRWRPPWARARHRPAARPARAQPAQPVLRAARAGARARNRRGRHAARLHPGLPVGGPARPPRRIARLPRHRAQPVRALFSGVAVSRAAALRPAGAPRAGARARPAGLGDATAGASRPTTAAGAALGRTGAADSTPPQSNGDWPPPATAFANFDVAVAPSASLAREYATLGFPTATRGRLRLRVCPAGPAAARGRP